VLIKTLLKSIILKKKMQIEIMETLSDICLYIQLDGFKKDNGYGQFMHTHYNNLQDILKEYKGEK